MLTSRDAASQSAANARTATRYIDNGAALPIGARHRTLMFVAPAASVSNALRAAIECEFRSLQLHVADNLDDACSDMATDVDLILVDRGFVLQLAQQRAELHDWHDGAPIAVLGSAGWEQDQRLLSLIEMGLINGIVPVNCSLDILLSIIRILLTGGEYMPAVLLRGQRAQPVKHCAKHQGDGLMNELTARELQILEHVAKGSQNKIIANNLGLSEHTVKIHIHNIINKLRVHNRTEAAAVYFARQNGAGSADGAGVLRPEQQD